MSQDWMEELREVTEPPDEAVAELRARVQGAVGRRHRWPYWALAAAAAVVLIAAIVAFRPAEVERLALHRPAAPVAPNWVLEKPSQRSTPRLPSHGRKEAVLDRPTHRASGGAAWIRIETADPNVVILLVSEGDSE